MTANFNLAVGESDGFTVRRINGCRIVYGSVPVSEFAMLTQGFSKKAVMATDIASRIGATMVIGEPGDIEALRKAELAPSPLRVGQAEVAQNRGVPKGVVEWLRTGERGLSSEALCQQLFGLPEDCGNEHPVDYDDLQRCLKFLDAAQAHDRIGEMASVSEGWKQLASHWPEILALWQTSASKERNVALNKIVQAAVAAPRTKQGAAMSPQQGNRS